MLLVDHSIFRAFHKGAMGILRVTGDPLPNVFSPIKGLGIAAGTRSGH